MASQIPIKVMCDGSGNTCGLAQFSSTDSLAVSVGGTGLTTQGVCAFTQPGINAVACKTTYIGICAGKSEGAANENTYVGYGAGQNVTTGCYHTIIGSNAGDAITTCSSSVLIGYNAGTAITFGDRNTAIGTSAGAAITTADDNTLVGYITGCVTTGNNNTGLGACTLALNTVGVDNVVIGSLAGKTQVAAGCNNTYIGSQAGEVALCRDNTLVGAYAGTAQTTATGNVMLGVCVGFGVVGGGGNVYLGYKSGLVNTSGNDNVFIGNCSGVTSTASCCLVIGNGTCDLITGDFNTASLGINAPIYSTLTVGVDDTGYDVKLFGASAGAFMLYDQSADTLDVRGATAAGPGVLKLTTGELTNVDGGILGRLEFQAPLDSAGGDACLVAASIWAEADATFSATVNTTDLVFATATSATATEKLRITSGGVLKINSAYCMPTADGSASQFLCTDGSGALAFATLVSSPWSTSGCFITVPAGCFVGIGTDTPDGPLTVANTSACTDIRTANMGLNIRNLDDTCGAQSGLQMAIPRDGGGYEAAGAIYMYSTGDGQNSCANALGFATRSGSHPTEKMTITGTGSVGIHSTDPVANLDMYGVSACADGNIKLTDGIGNANCTRIQIASYQMDSNFISFDSFLNDSVAWIATDIGSQFKLSKEADGFHVSYDGPAAAVGCTVVWNIATTWDVNGNVGIGTTAPGTYRLFVYNDIAGDFVASFRNDGNNANRHGIEVRGGADDGSGVTYYFAAQDGDGNGIGSLENNNGTFQLVDGSDARYKRDITDTVITGIDTLNKVRVIDFTRQKSDDRVIGGFSAQELLEVYPSAVSGTEDDVDEKGMPRPMGVAKDTFIPVLVKAIQELSVKVAALEAA